MPTKNPPTPSPGMDAHTFSYADKGGSEWQITITGPTAMVAPYRNDTSFSPGHTISCWADPLTEAEYLADAEEPGSRAMFSEVASNDGTSAPQVAIQPGEGEELEMSVDIALMRKGATGPMQVSFEIDPPISQNRFQSHTIRNLPTSGRVRVNYRANRGAVTVQVMGQSSRGRQGQLQATAGANAITVTVQGQELDNYYVLTGSVNIR